MPISLVMVVFLIWAGTWLGVFHYLPSPDDWQKRGQFGDLFGSVNALFSGLAFAGILYTIYLQRQELSLQRKELKLQRKEMAASRTVLAAQAEAQEYANNINIGQIKTASLQERIGILKIRIEGQGSTIKVQMIESMELIADQIKQIADDLEHENTDEYQIRQKMNFQLRAEQEKE